MYFMQLTHLSLSLSSPPWRRTWRGWNDTMAGTTPCAACCGFFITLLGGKTCLVQPLFAARGRRWATWRFRRTNAAGGFLSSSPLRRGYSCYQQMASWRRGGAEALILPGNSSLSL